MPFSRSLPWSLLKAAWDTVVGSLKSQLLQKFSNICQTVINKHSQMSLLCNLLTFPPKEESPRNGEHLIA